MKVYVTLMFCINQDKPPGDKHGHPPQDFACEHLFALFYKLINSINSKAHLSVTNHDHADEDDVDVGSQGFIVVDFINLRGNEEHDILTI